MIPDDKEEITYWGVTYKDEYDMTFVDHENWLHPKFYINPHNYVNTVKFSGLDSFYMSYLVKETR